MPNVGTVDRLLRALVGLVLIALPFIGGAEQLGSFAYGGSLWWVPVAVGLVALATAAMRFCPLYRVLGIRTCRLN
jgi:integral membrane sensor domain MASE1